MPIHPVFGLLLVAVLSSAGCASVPANLDLGTRHDTAHHAFVVQLDPPAAPAAINQIHTWQIKVAFPDGKPVCHAQISVVGGMPQHGHGLPTQPKVLREVAAGMYLLEGMKFSMTGWWEIKLAIEAGGVSDNVTFNTVVGSVAKR